MLIQTLIQWTKKLVPEKHTCVSVHWLKEERYIEATHPARQLKSLDGRQTGVKTRGVLSWIAVRGWGCCGAEVIMLEKQRLQLMSRVYFP